jgi:hypothetical protein
MHELDFNEVTGFKGERAVYAFSFEGDILADMEDDSE